MVVGFGFSPFAGIPSGSQSPYPAYPYAPPLVIQPEPGVSAQQAASPATTYWYYCRDQWVLPIHTALPRRLAGGPDDRDGLMAPMKEGIPSQ